jgi:hypothetical protein
LPFFSFSFVVRNHFFEISPQPDDAMGCVAPYCRSVARWLIGLLAAVVLLAGCGGDSGSSASDDYANDVCSNLSSWVADQEDAVKSLKDAGTSITEEDVRAAVGDLRDSTDVLVMNLKDLGPPQTDDGTEAKNEIDNLGTTLTQQVDTIEQALNSGGGVLAQASTITAAVSTAAKAVDSTYQSLKQLDPAGELQDSFKDSDQCKELGDQLENAGSSS